MCKPDIQPMREMHSCEEITSCRQVHPWRRKGRRCYPDRGTRESGTRTPEHSAAVQSDYPDIEPLLPSIGAQSRPHARLHRDQDIQRRQRQATRYGSAYKVRRTLARLPEERHFRRDRGERRERRRHGGGSSVATCPRPRRLAFSFPSASDVKAVSMPFRYGKRFAYQCLDSDFARRCCCLVCICVVVCSPLAPSRPTASCVRTT